jgi:hypothetical protein
MRSKEELLERIDAIVEPDQEAFNELFWVSMAHGMASGASSWARLFADIRGWTKGGGDNAEKEEKRLTDSEVDALIRAVLGEPPD